jgi:Flp pilus assembly protein TadG
MRSRSGRRFEACSTFIRRLRGGHGSVTAEFATALPAVVLVLGCCLGAIQVVGHHVRLTDAAADAARALARGDDEARVSGLVATSVESAVLRTSRRGEFVCALLSSPAAPGPLAGFGIKLEASSCALAGGM